MIDDEASLKKRLVTLLGTAASYNDKGFIWSRHSSEKIDEIQREYHAAQLDLARSIGKSVLGDSLYAAIETGEASRDGSGTFASLAERTLGVRRGGL